MTASGEANQIRKNMEVVNDPAWPRMSSIEDKERYDGSSSAVIHHFCSIHCIRDFAFLITLGNGRGGRNTLLMKTGSGFSHLDMKPISFAEWQLNKRFAQSFTPASITYSGGQLNFTSFENETEGLLALTDKQERAFFENLKAHSGYCVPLANAKGDRALAIVTMDSVPSADKMGIFYFKLLKIFETLNIKQSAESLRVVGRLTNREIECLKWVADGKTSLEIAAITSLSVHTINHYLKIVCSKLNTVNRIQAAVVAARQHLI